MKKPCCSRFSLNKFVHLKCFWTQFKNMHLGGPCNLRPCISRLYCRWILLYRSKSICTYVSKIMVIVTWVLSLSFFLLMSDFYYSINVIISWIISWTISWQIIPYKKKDGYSLPNNDLINNRVDWIWMSKTIGGFNKPGLYTPQHQICRVREGSIRKAFGSRFLPR